MDFCKEIPESKGSDNKEVYGDTKFSGNKKKKTLYGKTNANLGRIGFGYLV